MLFFPLRGGEDWWDTLFKTDSGVSPIAALDFIGDQYMANAVEKTFADLITSLRASTALVRGSNGFYSSASNDVSRFAHDKDGTPEGLELEETRQNICLWSDDWTNAAYDTVTTMTVAKDQTGADNVSNSASSLLATAGNALVTQAITNASATRVFSVHIKRITGSGNIELTQDGGSTWLDINSSLNSSTFTQVATASASVTNPVVGIRIATDTDKIAVQYGDSEIGGEATSPIPTTTVAVTRASENGIDFDFDVLAEFSVITAGAFILGANDAQLFHYRLSTDNPHRVNSTFKNNTTDIETVYQEITTHTRTINATVAHGITEGADTKVGARFATNDHKTYVDGSSKITDTSCNFAAADLDECGVGKALNQSNQHFARAHYRYYIVYPSGVTNADLIAGTT